MLKINEIDSLFNAFSESKVLIIGDIMVDAYLWGGVDRISPEAPVPIVAVSKRENRLGGAANVALNIKALGAKPILCSVIGDDVKGDEFMQLLDDELMSKEGILKSKKRITTTKFRVLGNNTQLLRVDEEITDSLNNDDKQLFLERVINIIAQADIKAIVFQDYDKGVIDKEVINTIISKANALNIPVAVDPKKKNFDFFKHATFFKPNLKELKEGMNVNFNSKDRNQLEEAVDNLQIKIDCKMLMVTLSEDGVFIKYRNNQEGKSYHEPAHRRRISDVSGAGDTVISTATLCLANGVHPADLAAISNLAGGLVCEEVGVVPVDKEKLLAEVKKIYSV